LVQLLVELPSYPEGVGACSVAFVYESDPGNLVSHHLPVNGNRLRLDPADGAQHQNGPVKDSEGAFHFDGEIDVTRRINNIDRVIAPRAISRGRLDGDSALLFEVHEIHCGAHSIFSLHIVYGVNAPGVEQDSLRESRFPGIYVRADADVS
jgi:hypothetical protein